MINEIISLSNGMNVTLQVDNARIIIVNPMLESVERKDDNNKISELNYIEEFKIAVNKELQIKKQIYKPQAIKKIDNANLKNGYYLFLHEINKSTNFIMPLLAPDNESTRQHYRWNDLCNCFVGTEEDADWGEYIYLLYRFNTSKEFFNLEQYFKSRKDFNDKIIVDDYHILYKFNVDELIKNDYDLILKGKYSEISEYSKEKILKFHFLPNDSPTYKILYKCDTRRKHLEETLEVDLPKNIELYDKFNVMQEIYFEDYKIKTKITNGFRAENPDYC